MRPGPYEARGHRQGETCRHGGADASEPSGKAGDSDEVVITDVAKQTEAGPRRLGRRRLGPLARRTAADEAQPAGDEAKSADKAERDGHAQPAGEARAAGDAELAKQAG